MGTKPRADVSGAIEAMNQAPTRGRGRKGPIYRWLRSNRAELLAAFAENAPAWGTLAEYLGTSGILNADGSPPTGSGVRSAWKRVLADAAKRQAAPGARAGPALPPSPPPLVRTSAPALKPEGEDDDGYPPLKPVSIRK